MSDKEQAKQSLFVKKVQEFFALLCQKEWNPWVTGALVGFLSVMMMAWWRPWGAVGAIRNWGNWIVYAVTGGSNGLFASYWGEFPLKGAFIDNGSVIGIAFVLGAFISACLGKDFALRIPPKRELVKAVIAGVLMGIGATLAGGCNVGGIYNALGNLAANGFAMMAGMVVGVVLGLKLLYLEMEHISWGNDGAKTFSVKPFVSYLLGIVGIIAVAAMVRCYSANDEATIAALSGLTLLSCAIGYAMQRGRWCMVQGFREPHMTGDCTLARSVMLSVFIVAIGGAVLKYSVPNRLTYVASGIETMQEEGVEILEEAGLEDEAEEFEELSTPSVPQYVTNPAYYVRGTFGWGGVVGGFIFGLGAMFAGGCGSGTLWRVGEGQVKLMLVVPFFALTSSLMTIWFKTAEYEKLGMLGKKIYLPDVMGYCPSLLLIGTVFAVWYIIVTWNEESNKLIVPM